LTDTEWCHRPATHATGCVREYVVPGQRAQFVRLRTGTLGRNTVPDAPMARKPASRFARHWKLVGPVQRVKPTLCYGIRTVTVEAVFPDERYTPPVMVIPVTENVSDVFLVLRPVTDTAQVPSDAVVQERVPDAAPL
jgi:hypothetical protein